MLKPPMLSRNLGGTLALAAAVLGFFKHRLKQWDWRKQHSHGEACLQMLFLFRICCSKSTVRFQESVAGENWHLAVVNPPSKENQLPWYLVVTAGPNQCTPCTRKGQHTPTCSPQTRIIGEQPCWLHKQRAVGLRFVDGALRMPARGIKFWCHWIDSFSVPNTSASFLLFRCR